MPGLPPHAVDPAPRAGETSRHGLPSRVDRAEATGRRARPEPPRTEPPRTELPRTELLPPPPGLAEPPAAPPPAEPTGRRARRARPEVPARPEEPPFDVARHEPRHDSLRLNQPTADQLRGDQPRVDQPRVDQPRVDQPRPDQPRRSRARAEQFQPDQATGSRPLPRLGEPTGRRAAPPPPEPPGPAGPAAPLGPAGPTQAGGLPQRGPQPRPGEPTGRQPRPRVGPPTPNETSQPGRPEMSSRADLPRPEMSSRADLPRPEMSSRADLPRPELPGQQISARLSVPPAAPGRPDASTRVRPDASTHVMPPAPPTAGPPAPPGPPAVPGAAGPAAGGSAPGEPPTRGPSARPRRPEPERREDVDPSSLTTEMEPIGEEVKKRREVDHTLARFSAVHDELAEEERQRRTRLQKYMPWRKFDEDDELDPDALPPVSDEDDEDDDNDPSRGKKTRRWKLFKAFRATAIVVAALVFVSTGFAWGAKVWVDGKFREVAALDQNSAAIQDKDAQYGDENFLLVGSDTRANASPEDNVGTVENEPGARSDTVMIAHVPADRKRVIVVSLPRDLLVERPDCEKWNPDTGQYTGETVAGAKDVKSNTAYSNGGPRCVTKLVQQLTGLAINHFISIDFQGFKAMVDAVDGVDVCVPGPMEDKELGWIFREGGKHKITGDQALSYVRARKVVGQAMTEYERIERQQGFIRSLLNKTVSNQVLLDPVKLNNFINAFANATYGENIGVDQLLTLAQSLQGLDPGKVTFVTVPHRTVEGPKGDNTDNRELLEADEADALFKAIRQGTPLPDEENGSASTGSGTSQQVDNGELRGRVIDPKGIKVQLFNGGAQGGLGNSTRTRLQELGFEVVRLENAKQNTPDTVVKYGAGHEDQARTVAAALPGAQMKQDPSMGGAIAITIGSNFDGTVQAPQQTSGGGALAQPAGDNQNLCA
ncbi:LCP family glycopolymer transferase [Goodfellowiella coeruleoviolacea]|uniref:LCP family glycopolymer transferase n=1 Tax=Goodfellowiella coeruleoviolacea TaxID=334858 RepID=UPI0027E0492E|nr:LCP family protein [Goodfellowiella coeruleoviolacea]